MGVCADECPELDPIGIDSVISRAAVNISDVCGVFGHNLVARVDEPRNGRSPGHPDEFANAARSERNRTARD